MTEVLIYSDGSAHNKGNQQGDGGYAYVIVKREDGVETVLHEGYGHEEPTTNNRMEMKGALEGIRKALELGHEEFEVRSDSSYLINCFRQKWYRKWRLNGWKNSKDKPVENKDIWEDLLTYHDSMDITWIHVKGHAGVKYNERCDVLAGEARLGKKSN